MPVKARGSGNYASRVVLCVLERVVYCWL